MSTLLPLFFYFIDFESLNKNRQRSMAQFGQRFAQQFQQGFAAEGCPYGTVSQLINSGRQGTTLSTALGDVVPCSQRIVQTGQHWWVNHPVDEPLP